MPTRTLERLAVAFLLAQALAAALWWTLLLVLPRTRDPFKAADAPDATLLAFGPPDALLFVAASALAAHAIRARRPWAPLVLAAHAGAAAYAALYCWSLVLLTRGDALLGALLMTPSLVVPPLVLLALLRNPTSDSRIGDSPR